MISGCLAQLVTTDFGDHSKMAALLNLPPLTSCKNDDFKYKREIRLGFVKEFSRLATRLTLDHFIHSNSASVVEVLVENLLDLHLLRRIPSCNLVRIKRIHGGEAEQVALMKLLKFNGAASSAVRRDMEESHNFVCRLGLGMRQHSMDIDLQKNWIDSWNVNINPHQSWTCQLQPSMEKELLDVFRVLRNLLDFSSTEDSPICYEQTARVIIATCTSNLMMQYDRLRPLSLVMKNATSNPYSYAKLDELFSSSFELLVTIISLILRSGEGLMSESFAQFAVRFWKRFLSPVIRNETFCIRSSLSSICDSLSSDFPEPDTTTNEESSVVHQQIRSNSIPCLRAILLFCVDRRDNAVNVEAVDVLNVLFTWATRDEQVVKVIPLLFSNCCRFLSYAFTTSTRIV
jgi:hypothetical protein